MAHSEFCLKRLSHLSGIIIYITHPQSMGCTKLINTAMGDHRSDYEEQQTR